MCLAVDKEQLDREYSLCVEIIANIVFKETAGFSNLDVLESVFHSVHIDREHATETNCRIFQN